ncbi:MAG: phosphoribosyltransferase domain-containing protein, partial [Oscillospiraceae bacterium]|nr:phosphoribosyltransferase domain-containing protein [Oscillospiraceae bacterium]
MEYRENDLIRIARRHNNTKRNYLIVDPLQGKHIPVSPTAALDAMSALGKRVSTRYPDAGL